MEVLVYTISVIGFLLLSIFIGVIVLTFSDWVLDKIKDKKKRYNR